MKHVKPFEASQSKKDNHRNQDSLYQIVFELKSQFQELRATMNFEIDIMRQKIALVEMSNKSLKEIQEQMLENQRFQDIIDNNMISQENIDDDYKSKKRHINEQFNSVVICIYRLSINLDVPPTVKLNLKQLSSQTQSSKQLLKDLKREMNEVNFCIKNLQKINKDKYSNDKKRESQQQQKSRELFINSKRPATALKDPKQQIYYNQIISPTNKYDEADLESTLQAGMTNKANTPIESPYRNKKEKILQQQEKSSSLRNKHSVSGLNLSDKLQTKNVLNQLQKQTLANYKVNQNSTSKIKDVNNNLNPRKSSIKNLNKSLDDESKQLKLGDQLAVVESPKFLNFINSITARKLEEKSNPVNAKTTMQSKDIKNNQKIPPQTGKNQASQPIDIQDFYNDDEHEMITERGIKPAMTDKVLLSSGRLTQEQSIVKAQAQQNPYPKQNKNPLIKSYMNHRPQNFNHNESNDLDDDDSMDSDECDEKRSYTPEPRHLEKLANKSASNLNHSIIGMKGSLSTSMSGMIAVGGVNSVYKSSNMELSRYISKHKSNVDYQNKFNVMEFGGYKALLDSKGSKCQCKIKGLQENIFDQINVNKTCGNYCKLLGSKDQKRIILECLQKELEKTPQLKKIKRYLIDAKWIRKWCDYTNFDTNIISNNFSQQIKSQVDDELEDSLQQQSDRNIRFDSATLYQKPLKIENLILLDLENKRKTNQLRDNLVENFDFISVSPLIWLHLYSWYSADFQVARYMKRDKFNTNQYVLELYPYLKQAKLNLSYMGPQQQDSSESEDDDDRKRELESPQLRNKQQIHTTLQNRDQMTISSRVYQEQNARKQTKLSNKSQEIISTI